MTNEEIQALRQQYRYDPTTLNTGVVNPVTDTNVRLARLRGQEEQTTKAKGASQVKSFVGGVSEGAGTNLALSAIDYVGKKAIQALPENASFAGVTKEQMLKNIENSPSLNEKFKEQMGGNENPNAYSAGKVTGVVATAAPLVVEQIPKLLATRTGQKIVTKGTEIVKPVVDTAKDIVKTGKEAIAKRNISKVENLINPTEDMLTPLQKKSAIEEGRQTNKLNKAGGTDVSYLPSEKTTRAANILSDTVKASDKPNVVFAKIKTKIAERGAQAEKYLAENPVKVTNKEDFELFQGVKDKASKIHNPSALKAYNDEIKLFQKQLQGRPGGYTTENYYKALKDWENNVADSLPKGKEAILDPTGVGSARIHAASDIRKAVRDLIGSKHPDFKNQMYDLVSLYEAKGNALQIASKTKSKSFFEKNPRIKTGLQIGAGAVGGQIGINALKGE